MGPSLAGFNADWASPPGDLIEEVLEEVGWTRAELAHLGLWGQHLPLELRRARDLPAVGG